MSHRARTSPGPTNGVNGGKFHCVDGAAGKLKCFTRKEKKGVTIQYHIQKETKTVAARQYKEESLHKAIPNQTIL
eukprot:10033654-Ditylum_brightwellii.AAC.1